MSLIERAAKRLEELRRAGVVLPDSENAIAPYGSQTRSGLSQNSNFEAANSISANGPSSVSRRPPEPESEPTTRFDLDLEKLAALGFVTPLVQRSRIADEFRILKRPLIANASDKKNATVKHRNLIMVTSSLPGEGKTFTAVNLAMSLALELDKTVLLVDADVARPSLPTLLGLASAKGLLDVLQNKSVALEQVLLRTNVEKLSLLPSGSPTTSATELLASGAMTDLLEELAGRYPDRIIIFDSPPLLVTTEARVLAMQMGQIVFVVHAETTLQADVKKALSTIESCPIKMMVLNQATSTGQGAHGYGYGYGYGS